MSTSTATPIQAPGDKAERLQIWHSPKPSTLLEIVAAPAASHPGVTPLWFSYDGRTSEPLTWRALWDGAMAVGSRLSTLLSSPQEAVVIAAPTSPAFFHAFFGVLRRAMTMDSLEPAGVYFGTTSGALYASGDEGQSWSCIAQHLPGVLSVETLVLD